MSLDPKELSDAQEFAVAIAREAGKICLRYFMSSLTLERKADDSVVTVADREAEEFLRRRIMQSFPADGILGEEFGESTGVSERRWIIDPIDGTYSFVHGVPLYAVLIGLQVGDETVMGVVNLPALNEVVYAARGLGCFLNDRRVRVSTTQSVNEALLLSTDFGSCSQFGFGAAAEDLQRRAFARRTWGDAYGHVLVATGRGDIMLDPIMNIWDCAALSPIVEEAGGTFTDWSGKRTVDGGNAISTNGKLFAEVMRTITEMHER